MSDEELLYLIEDDEMMRRAIERARELRPKVRVVNAKDRLFMVESRHNSHRYLVKFTVTPSGRRLASCRNQNGEPCKGLTPRTRCYHVASSAACNIYAQTVLRQIAGTVAAR
jgi:hypothetical protein